MLVPDSALTLARIADAPAIAERSRTLIEAGLPWSWVPRRVEASIRHPETNVVVARVREGIAGFGIMRYGLEEAHLNLFAVEVVSCPERNSALNPTVARYPCTIRSCLA